MQKGIMGVLLLILATILYSSCSHSRTINNTEDMAYPNEKSNEEWKSVLAPFQYQVLRESATERPFTGEYYDTRDTGVYYCAGCGDF